MAYYCKVTDLTRPNLGVIMVHFNMHDDADDSVVQGPMTHGFNVVTYDANGDVMSETGNQKKARMAAEYDAYCERLMTDATLVDANFDALKAQAVGYIYAQAGV